MKLAKALAEFDVAIAGCSFVPDATVTPGNVDFVKQEQLFMKNPAQATAESRNVASFEYA